MKAPNDAVLRVYRLGPVVELGGDGVEARNEWATWRSRGRGDETGGLCAIVAR